MAERLALFPLNTVLFPGGPLPLRIFEPRYLDLVSACLREERPFGVCLIAEGREAGVPARPHPVGVTARIIDWHQLDDGLLGIVCRGEERFRVLATRAEPNGLLVGEVERLAPEPTVAVPEHHRPLADLARALMERTGPLYAGLEPRFDDAAWVGHRLAEILDLPLPDKQRLLEMDEPLARIEALAEAAAALARALSRRSSDG